MEIQPQHTPENETPVPHLSGELVGRNVRISGRRTSVRLEPEMWEALYEVASLENCSIHDLCGAVDEMRAPAASFTGALRVFLMEYFRNAVRINRTVSHVQKCVAGGKEAKSS